ncbi:MAG: DUF4446 family protein [Patescibacteria group bacterium]
MDNSIILLLSFGLFFLAWNIALTILILKIRKKNKLFFESSDENVYELLRHMVADNKKFNKRSEKVEQGLDEIARIMKLSFQKIGVVRYNPFKDTGGDMSFSLALLNLENSGIVITSIHGRGADRVYAKPIEKGKSQHNLSAEEIEAINKAIE